MDLMNPAELQVLIVNFFNWWALVIGGISMILKGLEMLAKVTKTKTDDIKIAKLRKYCNVFLKILHSFALTPHDPSRHAIKDDPKDS